MATRATPQPRRMDFQFDPKMEKYWFHGNSLLSTMISVMSGMFPEGERFFIHAVRYYQGRITDPDLQREIRAFIGQEAHHGNAHEKVNQLITERGIPVNEVEAQVINNLKMAKGRLKPRGQLAITIALEHFTAMLANWLLQHPEVMDDLPRDMQELFVWHAIEEIEHKSVAFDVYQQCEGNYFVRSFFMMTATFKFLREIVKFQIKFLWRDRHFPRWWEFLGAGRFLFGRGGALSSTLGHYFSYYRPGFHPWQHDNSHLIADWEKRFPRVSRRQAA